MKTTNHFSSTRNLRRFLLLAVVAVSMVATQTRQADAAKTVKIKGGGTSAFVVTPVYGPNGTPIDFKAPGQHQAIISHLGKTVGMSLSSGAGAPGKFKVDFMTLKAANGDEIYTVGVGKELGPGPGNPAQNPTLIEIDFTITGGTGRFKNATGSFKYNSVRVLAGFSPPSILATDSFRISGTITTVGSSK